MTHLDLFSGIGGIALAARWAGFSTRLFCEIEPYAQRVLRKHWPRVPIHDDIRTLTAETLQRHGVGRPTLLTGGFPCQPFSCAGKRKGTADDRFLWPEMLRIIAECRPAWVVGENVAGFVRLGLDRALADLEGEGYECRTFVLPACAVGAPHQRMRVFIVAHAQGGQRRDFAPDAGNGAQREGRGEPGSPCADAGLAPDAAGGVGRGAPRQAGYSALFRWWKAEPRICRVADGVPRRVDRLRGLGNAVVPQQIYPILAGIAAASLPVGAA